MRTTDSILWDQIPGLSAALGADAAVLGASDALLNILQTRGGPDHWCASLSEPSRRELLDRLGRPENFRATLQLADGTGAGSLWLVCEGFWMAGMDCHVCHFSDTTPIEQARVEAQTLVERIQLIFKHLPVMVAHFGPPPLGVCEFANQQFAELLGGDVKTIVGTESVDRIFDSARSTLQPFLRQALKQSEPVTFPFAIRSARGPLVQLEVTVIRRVNPTDAAAGYGFSFLITDITERHRAELAMRESEDRLSRFLNANQEGVLLHVNGLITDANPAISQLFGAPASQLLGRPVLELIPPEFRDRISAIIASGADASYESEIFNLHGQRIPVEIIGRSMMRNGERLRMAVVRDIRDRREAQARIHELIEGLRAEKDKAEAADRAKSVFLAAASHDLRQPIHALGLFLTALRSMSQAPSVRSADLAELCQRMQASLDGLGQLLNMLLDVSRLDANAVQVEREPTSAQRLLEELDQDFHQIASDKGLRLHVVSSRLWVDTDPTVLRRILTNLVSNAVRYTSRGRVLIGCRPRGPEVEFQVWDSGIGIPAEQRDAIFEEFFQIGQSTAEHHESHGLGLGLSIVKRSALLLHAPLNLLSIPGRGSMFSIRVPRCPPPAHTTAARLA